MLFTVEIMAHASVRITSEFVTIFIFLYSGSETELESEENIPRVSVSVFAQFYRAIGVKGGLSKRHHRPKWVQEKVLFSTPPAEKFPRAVWQSPQPSPPTNDQKIGEDVGTNDQKTGEDAFGPELPSQSCSINNSIGTERLAKTIVTKRIAVLAEIKRTNSKTKKLNWRDTYHMRKMIRKVKSNPTLQALPRLMDSRILLILTNFVGPDNNSVTTKTDNKGVRFQRVTLLDGSVAHDWVIT